MAAVHQLVRLNKILAQKGICSRREADKFIEQGLIKANGRVASLGDKYLPNDVNIQVDPRALQQQSRQKTILINKPRGIVSSQPDNDSYTPAVQLLTADRQFHSQQGPKKIADRNFDPRFLTGWRAAGRLDINSTGLLVLTQSGRVARKLIGEDSNVEKEYLVGIQPTQQFDRRQSTDEILQRIRQGIVHDGDKLNVVSVERLEADLLNMVLTEGKKHQIRRICQSLNFRVTKLHRVRIGNVRLGNLPSGCWRYLTSTDSFL